MSLPFLPPDIRQRVFKQRTRLNDMTNFEVRKHCGMPLVDVQDLFEVLGPNLQRETRRSEATTPENQFITALSFFRSGSFQYVEGTVGGVSQATISQNLDRVCNEICNHISQSIRFPVGIHALNTFKKEFHDIGLFPNIVGVIDGTHVNIKSPSHDESTFINRKGVHSINIQLVCAPNHSFTDAIVKWPGATHDSYIWNNSGLKQRFENGDFGESWLIGDSGYGVHENLLTPFKDPFGRGRSRYNSALKKTRCIIERSIGIWKSRFRSMDKSGGTLCYNQSKACKLMLASLYLHNYCVNRSIELDEEDEQYAANYRDDMTSPDGVFDRGSGIATRNNVVRNYFS